MLLQLRIELHRNLGVQKLGSRRVGQFYCINPEPSLCSNRSRSLGKKNVLRIQRSHRNSKQSKRFFSGKEDFSLE